MILSKLFYFPFGVFWPEHQTGPADIGIHFKNLIEVGDFKYLLNDSFDARQFNISADFCKLGVKTDQDLLSPIR
ncbi:MAG: hypothetical protein B6I22_11495 [Desulfobacteraceae bacterium 4572_123]|nr:MAG: hypothetical protein B6I22_11495 [Desulfobacteraceae bacterium 4572_123]